MSARLSASDVEAFLAGLSHQQRRTAEALRRLVHRAVPEAEETVLWGSLSYHRSGLGGRIKGAVCLITPRFDEVHLGFIHGAALEDPCRLLRGSSKTKRFVPIQRVQDIDREALSGLIRAAAKYDPRRSA